MKSRKLIISILTVLLITLSSVIPIYAWGVTGDTNIWSGYTKLDSKKIQNLTMNWNNCSVPKNTQWTVAKNAQIDYTNTCSNVFELAGVKYDIVFHYKAIEWQNRQIYHYEDGYVAGGSIPSTIKFKPYAYVPEGNLGYIPAIEFLGNTSYYSPDIIVDVDVYKHGTTQRISSNDIAFAINDLDHSNDGFFYVGNDITAEYTNTNYGGNILAKTANGRRYFTDKNPPTKYDMCLDHDPWYTTCYLEASSWDKENSFSENKGTVILKSTSISNGHFTIGSYFNNKGGTHIGFSGIIFIGSEVDIKYYSDNTSDDLSGYNATFIGSVDDDVPYTDKATTTAALRQRGFVVVRDDFGNGKKFKEGKQTYEIHVEYRPQQAKTVFIDKTNNNALIGERAILMGVPGENIVDSGYKTSGSINTQILLDRGYKLVSDEYTTNPKFDDVQGNIQEIKVILEHTYTTVDKDTYEPKKCLNRACTAEQPEKGC